MTIDRAIFFRGVRQTLFSGLLRQHQVEGMTALLDLWEARLPASDPRWLAYMLATAHHETGATMQPVRETFASSDARAIAIMDAAFRRGRLPWVSTPYWRRDADGKSWLGRGLVQLTHRANYARMAEITGIDLVAHPERAMELAVAAEILVVGMKKGSFTGRKLAGSFSGLREDWLGARRIINGRDRAAQVAGHGRLYLAALRLAGDLQAKADRSVA
jgi:hypothetical protein